MPYSQIAPEAKIAQPIRLDIGREYVIITTEVGTQSPEHAVTLRQDLG